MPSLRATTLQFLSLLASSRHVALAALGAMWKYSERATASRTLLYCSSKPRAVAKRLGSAPGAGLTSKTGASL